jgi:hypothetical protein
MLLVVLVVLILLGGGVKRITASEAIIPILG